MKRTKDRRKLVHSSSFRFHRSTSPYLVEERSNPETVNNFARLNLPFNGDSSTLGTSFTPVVRRERSSSSCCLTYRGSPYDVNGINSFRRNSDPSSGLSSNHAFDNSDDEQPLDMSKKSRTSDGSESHRKPNSGSSSPETVHSIHQQQARPSVITCASSLRSKHISSPHNCSSCGLSKDFSKCLANNDGVCAKQFLPLDELSSEKSFTDEITNDDGEIPCKRQILKDDCDSVIDEHFRRSLGNQYLQIFKSEKKTSNECSVSVDDHFAKALGETWYKLNKKPDHNCKESNYNTNAQSIIS